MSDLDTSPRAAAAGTDPRPPVAPEAHRRWRHLFASQEAVLIYVLVALTAFFTSINPTFLSVGVFGNILVTWAPMVLIAMGELFVIVTAGIDLSVGSTITISGVIAAFAMAGMTGAGAPDALSLVVGTLVSLGIGLAIGLINAFLINIADLGPFVATLVTLGAGSGLALVLTKGGPVAGGPSTAIGLIRPTMGPFSWPIIIVIVIIVIAGLFLHKSRFGRYTYAIGGSAFSATAVGISVKKHLTKVYCLSGMFAGAAGMIVYLTLGSGSPTSGLNDELQAIAAVVIGGASLLGGAGKALGAVLGALILLTVTSGLVIINIDPNWNQVVVAVLIAAAVGMQTVQRRLKARRHTHGVGA